MSCHRLSLLAGTAGDAGSDLAPVLTSSGWSKQTAVRPGYVGLTAVWTAAPASKPWHGIGIGIASCSRLVQLCSQFVPMCDLS